MRKIFFGLTTALALGTLALPTVAYAQRHSGGGGGGSHVSSGGGGGGMRAGNFGGGRSFNAARGFSSNRAVATRNFGGRNFTARNFTRRNFAVRNNFAGRHHRGFAGFIGGYGAYAGYDYCWRQVWTPYGYERVYICEPDPYGYY